MTWTRHVSRHSTTAAAVSHLLPPLVGRPAATALLCLCPTDRIATAASLWHREPMCPVFVFFLSSCCCCCSSWLRAFPIREYSLFMPLLCPPLMKTATSSSHILPDLHPSYLCGHNQLVASFCLLDNDDVRGPICCISAAAVTVGWCTAHENSLREIRRQ